MKPSLLSIASSADDRLAQSAALKASATGKKPLKCMIVKRFLSIGLTPSCGCSYF